MRNYIRLAVTAAAVLTVAVSTFHSFGAVRYVEEDSYFQPDEDEDSSEDWFSEDTVNGPGTVVDGAALESLGAGVYKVSITEQYYEDYGVYEESIGEIFFFYSNVSNGGITDKPVIIDLPVNLSYTMEKDGAPYGFSPGQSVSEKGTYVLKLSGIEDTTLPLSEQKEYQAVYRFRIQDKLPETTEARLAEAANVVSGIAMPSLEMVTESEQDEMTEGETIEGETAEEMNEENQPEEENGDRTVDDEDEAESDYFSETGESAAQKRSQEYDRALDKYLVTLENGRSLVSNIPEGIIFSGPAELTVSEEDLGLAELYLNDSPIEYVRGNSLTDQGNYRLVLDGQSYSFTIALATSVMGTYPAPAGMTFTEAYLNEQPIELLSSIYVPMEADGQYRFVMEGEKGDRAEVNLKKDTEAPKASVSIKNGTASIQYLSDDIAEITLKKDGGEETSFNGNSVSEPGSYLLSVRDEAGNQSILEFRLKYQVNTYGIAAVIIVILVVAGTAAFVIHTKRTIKIR